MKSWRYRNAVLNHEIRESYAAMHDEDVLVAFETVARYARENLTGGPLYAAADVLCAEVERLQARVKELEAEKCVKELEAEVGRHELLVAMLKGMGRSKEPQDTTLIDDDEDESVSVSKQQWLSGPKPNPLAEDGNENYG